MDGVSRPPAAIFGSALCCGEGACRFVICAGTKWTDLRSRYLLLAVSRHFVHVCRRASARGPHGAAPSYGWDSDRTWLPQLTDLFGRRQDGGIGRVVICVSGCNRRAETAAASKAAWRNNGAAEDSATPADCFLAFDPCLDLGRDMHTYAYLLLFDRPQGRLKHGDMSCIAP